MTDRIIRFRGYGFGDTDATVKVTFDGTEIFNGAVTTTTGLIPVLPDDQYLTETVVLFTEETTPVTFAGTKTMTCEVTNGKVMFAQIESNYMTTANPVYSTEELAVLNSDTATRAEKLAVMAPHAVPAFSAADESIILNSTDYTEIRAVMAAHGCSIYVNRGADQFSNIDNTGELRDPRTNVKIDGLDVTPDRGGNLNGTWWWLVDEGSILTYDLEISPGAE